LPRADVKAARRISIARSSSTRSNNDVSALLGRA